MPQDQQDKTHREVKEPQISARYLADFMAASERAARTIVRGCKYQPIARVVQHDHAKSAVAKFIRDGHGNTAVLTDRANDLREQMADTDFDRDVLDHNADYIDRFAAIYDKLDLPNAEILMPGKAPAVVLKGVKVTTELHFRLQRITKTNKVRVGGGALRYAKGRALASDVADYQSAFMFGYLNVLGTEDGADVERKLCLTVDAYSGKCHPAPTDSVNRFHDMKAACATISEWWPNIAPPPNAKF
jgi:hypothetical protein